MSVLNHIFMLASISILILCLAGTLVLLLFGRQTLTRIIGLEMLANLMLVGIAIWSLMLKQPIYIDCCLVIALIMFLTNTAFFYYLTPGQNDDSSD